MSVNVLNYYGSKIKLAPKYPRHGGRVVEPFAGGAGYSLATHAPVARLHDLDASVCAAWSWFLAASPEDILALPLLEPGQDVRTLGLPDGARCLIGYWLNRSSVPCNVLSAWAAGNQTGPNAVSFWTARRRALLAEHRASMAADDWQISRSSYETSWRGADWFYFVDPPYQTAGKHYRHGSKGFDFGALAEWCRWVASKGAPIVVCENDGADWLPFEYVSHINGLKTVACKRRQSIEVAWTANTTPQTRAGAFDFGGAACSLAL